jgi:5'-nucleotidase
VNINLPCLREGEQPAGMRFVRQCTRPWVDTYEQRKDPRGRDYFWNSSVFTLGPSESDTDVAALKENYITITPLQFDLTDQQLLSRMQANAELNSRERTANY